MSVAAESRPAQRPRAAFARMRREFNDPEKRTAYWMVLPAMLVVVVVALWPVLYSLYLSFQRILPTATSFVGLDNYVQMFSDSAFFRAVLNTFVFTVFSVFFEFVLGLGIALVLNRGYVGQGVTRAIAIVPWAFPTVVSGIIWRLMYQDQIGIFAHWAAKLGIVSGPILANESAILVGAVIADVWKTTPFVALLLLAGLQVIPPGVYEAARVDGATPWEGFTQITLPLLKPAILVALLFRTLDAWRVYDLFWVMSDRQLDSLSTYTFEFVRISEANQSIGPAAAMLVFFSSLVIAVLFIKLLGKRIAER